MSNPKAIKLLGSCHCKAVRYSLMSSTPAPYCVCYCGVCRKLNGGNGACVSLTGDAKTFQAEGTQHLGIYRPKIEESNKKAETLPGWHHFCKLCGTQLWIWEPSSPEMINPMASSVDTTLPTPPERHHIFLKDKAPWVHVPDGKDDKHFDEFTDVSPPKFHKEKSLN